ncbi:hypothetical protein Taro_022578 [Colocasia esculenta]|uniref:Secreted protein n=1 Tax=Colocasia esculenta TaxID=4460 RepID=A0A843V1X4_COLES|nr:hypothetical protein [Colocasia esculenta]
MPTVIIAFVLVYGLLELGEFPTEPVTSEAHPYSPQAKGRRRFRYRLSVLGRVVAVLGQRLQQCSFRSSRATASLVALDQCRQLHRRRLASTTGARFSPLFTFHTLLSMQWQRRFLRLKVKVIWCGLWNLLRVQFSLEGSQNFLNMNEDKRCHPILFHSEGPEAGSQ